MRTSRQGRSLGAVGIVTVLAAGCLTKEPPEQHFFEQHVQPVLNNFCVGNTSPCHRIDQETGTALGNLDLTSFAAVQKRRDVLRTYGSYPHPLLLLKALPEESVQIPYGDKLYRERDPARGRQADRRQLGRVLRAQALAGQRRQPRRHRRPPRRPRQGVGQLQQRSAAAQPPPDGRYVGGQLPDVRRRHPADPAAVVRVRHLPQLAAGRLLPDLRRRRREHDGVQLRPGGGLRRADAGGGRAERDPAAAAVAAGRWRQPHRRRVLQVARRRDLEDAPRLGRAGARRAAERRAGQDRGRDVLRGAT